MTYQPTYTTIYEYGCHTQLVVLDEDNATAVEIDYDEATEEHPSEGPQAALAAAGWTVEGAWVYLPGEDPQWFARVTRELDEVELAAAQAEAAQETADGDAAELDAYAMTIGPVI